MCVCCSRKWVVREREIGGQVFGERALWRGRELMLRKSGRGSANANHGVGGEQMHRTPCVSTWMRDPARRVMTRMLMRQPHIGASVSCGNLGLRSEDFERKRAVTSTQAGSHAVGVEQYYDEGSPATWDTEGLQ